MNMGDEGIALLKEFEGCELEAYPDPGTGGDPWTVGYGHTGSEVVPGMTIKQYEADNYLRRDLDKFEMCVTVNVKRPINQNQFDALVCFAYNVGCGAFGNSTLLRKLNAGDIEGASQEFLRWNRAGGRSMPGLTRRRVAERTLFMKQP